MLRDMQNNEWQLAAILGSNDEGIEHYDEVLQLLADVDPERKSYAVVTIGRTKAVVCNPSIFDTLALPRA